MRILPKIAATLLLALALVGTFAADANALRTRRNIMSLNATQKARFVNACIALKGLGTIDTSMVPWHQNASNLGFAHGSRTFLPWHREYLRRFEDALRGSGSAGATTVTIPYWDSSAPGNPFAPDLAGSLEHEDREPLPRQRNRRRQSVGAGADDHGIEFGPGARHASATA